MVAKIDRTGEEGYNNFGSKMIIVRSNGNNDIDILFPKYKYIVKNRMYTDFKRGKISCPYEPRIFNKGYIGEGKYKISKNGKYTKVYKTWKNMLERCYDEKFQNKNPTYKNCTVYEEWHNFQNFAKWYENNYYEINNQKMCLDKDILIKGNKIYSPETCLFVPSNINNLFVKNNAKRGDLPIGVYYYKRNGKFKAQCSDGNKYINLGNYNTPQEAFQVYKKFKENLIKQVADEYKPYIPKELYEAMYRWEVDIND